MSERDLFDAALAIEDPAQRAAYLDRVCAGDGELREHLVGLLCLHGQEGSFLESPALAMVATTDGPMSERPGTVIGPYKLLEQIGEGGFGVVFMAEQQEPIRRKVALKVLKPGMDTRQVVARFEAERQALALMDHPNIAHVFDGGQTASGRPYFVMELVRGFPITEFCDQDHLSIHERLELFLDLCKAVQHAHQKGIIHRDLKPSNVLVTLHDDKAVVKVIDFGIVKAAGQQLTEKTLFTHFAQMIGTPLYMSPEQAQMNGLDVDTRSDIYSLGVLLYELLTGTTPFDRERLRTVGYDEIRRIIREEEPDRPSTRLSTLGQAAATVSASRQSDPRRLSELCRGELDWIVMKALEKDRNCRYETANAFAVDVQRYLRDEPVQARPPSALYYFRKFARRNKASLLTAACVLVGFVALAGSIGWRIRDKAVQKAETVGAVNEALAKATDWRTKRNWPEALAAARRAEALLKLGRGDGDLARRVETTLRELELVARVEEIRVEKAAVKGNRFYSGLVDPLYAQAFRQYGLGRDTLDPIAAAERLRGSAVREPLLAALDDWVLARQEEGIGNWEVLLLVARRADPDPWRDRLRDALLSKNGKAIADLARNAEVSSLSPASLVLLGRTLAKSGNMPLAVMVLHQAQQRYPDDFWINHNLALCLMESTPMQPAAAVGFYRAALALRPGSAGVVSNLGNALRAQGQLADAVAAYEKAIAMKPHFAMAHSNLGSALAEQGRLEAAVAACQEAIHLEPAFAAAHFNHGVALYKQGKDGMAEAAFREAIHLEPSYPDAHYNLGNTLKDQHRLKEAVVAYREAIRLKPDYPQALNNLGFVLRHLDNFSEAMDVYRAAIRLKPDLTEAHNNLGAALAMQRKFPEAEAAFREVLRLKPDDALAHRNLGNVLSQQGQWPGAVAAYRDALRLDPQDVVAQNGLAWILATSTDPKLRDAVQAVGWAKKAVQRAPNVRSFWITLGVAFYRAGDWKGSIAAMEKSVALGKGAAAYDWFMLAMAHWQQGDKEEARRLYDRGMQWMEKNAPRNEDLRRFQTEAAKVLELKK